MRSWKPPPGIDPDCIDLCRELNRCPGIKTVESCCGHKKKPFRIWFTASSLKRLPLVCWHFDGCHCGSYEWRIVVQTDCCMSPATFMIEGPCGDYGDYGSSMKNIVKLFQESFGSQAL